MMFTTVLATTSFMAVEGVRVGAAVERPLLMRQHSFEQEQEAASVRPSAPTLEQIEGLPTAPTLAPAAPVVVDHFASEVVKARTKAIFKVLRETRKGKKTTFANEIYLRTEGKRAEIFMPGGENRRLLDIDVQWIENDHAVYWLKWQYINCQGELKKSVTGPFRFKWLTMINNGLQEKTRAYEAHMRNSNGIEMMIKPQIQKFPHKGLFDHHLITRRNKETTAVNRVGQLKEWIKGLLYFDNQGFLFKKNETRYVTLHGISDEDFEKNFTTRMCSSDFIRPSV